MEKKGKTKQQILFEEKTKPFLNDYSVQVQDKIDHLIGRAGDFATCGAEDANLHALLANDLVVSLRDDSVSVMPR